MRRVLDFLSGKKTYIVCLATILYAVGINRNWWPHDASIDLIFGGTGAITIRLAIKKLCRQVEKDSYLENLSQEKDLLRAATVAAPSSPIPRTEPT